MSYRVLVLPRLEQIDLDVMRRIERLVLDGMVLVGEPPRADDGLVPLSGWGQGTERHREPYVAVQCGQLAGRRQPHRKPLRQRARHPRQKLSHVLRSLSAPPDFSYVSDNPATKLDYIHRATDRQDIYFVANRFALNGIDDYYYRYTPVAYDRFEDVECRFRVTGRTPEFWDRSRQDQPGGLLLREGRIHAYPDALCPRRSRVRSVHRRRRAGGAHRAGSTAAVLRFPRRSPPRPAIRRSGSNMRGRMSMPPFTTRDTTRCTGRTEAPRSRRRNACRRKSPSAATGACASTLTGARKRPLSFRN